MRLPAIDELTDEQKNVYLYAPLDGRIFVVGPPGTGKTLIAYLRAKFSAGKGQPTVLAMFNRVLQGYTANVEDLAEDSKDIVKPAGSGNEIEIKTLQTWFYDWWDNSKISTTTHSDRIWLDVSYDEKDSAKSMGARWNPSKWRFSKAGKLLAKGTWAVDREIFEKDPSLWERWSPKPEAPRKGSKGMSIAWDDVLEVVKAEINAGTLEPARIHWGHLVIDEGQDFAPDFYKMLNLVLDMVFTQKKPLPPVVTVFADQNQRLNEGENSTLQEIKERLSIEDDRYYSLQDNFRNARPIAKLASYFEADRGTGIARIPDKAGAKPKLIKTKTRNSAISYIARYASNHVNQEIAVIIPDNGRIRQKYYEALESKLTSLTVQTYQYDDKRYRAKLQFDKPGIVSVINRASCKGLEFDAVFIVELQEIQVEAQREDQLKMNLFVAIARAREEVALMYVNSGTTIPEVIKKMPPEKLLERVDA